MPNVSKEMVDAVRMARWQEWEKLAAKLPRGRHILSVELLRTSLNETAVVLTVVVNHRLVQYELRADAKGQNPKPVISRQSVPAVCLQPGYEHVMPHLAGFIMRDLGSDAGDGGAVANGVAIGEPPPKEPPHPGAVALGDSLLGVTFNLGESALDPTSQT